MGEFKCLDKHVQMVVASLTKNYLTAGPYIEEFEHKIAKYHGKKYGVFVTSGQAALEVALVLAKTKIEKEHLRVLVPSTTYLATIWAILNTNNTPVFKDIQEKNFIINPSVSFYDQEIDVAIPVDLCGYSAHKEAQKIRDKNENIFIINDACESVGNSMVGYGDITCVSFFTSHIITTGFGGMILIDDLDFVKYARSYISHGRMFGGDFTKFQGAWCDRFKFDKIGGSLRESSLSAALGLAEFDNLEEYVQIRKNNAYQMINSSFSKIKDNFSFPSTKYWNNSVFQFMPVVCRDHINRTEFLKYLYEKGVDSRVLLSITNQPIIERMYGKKFKNKFPVSRKINEQGFLLPCHHHMTKEDTNIIIEAIETYKVK